jgi:DeoR/GlpR family transcriptional regulator of sugar metabolism
MIPEERRNNILIKLKENGFLRIDELAENLEVSKITVIRDISILKDNGLVKKIHGGVKLNENGNNNIESSFFVRMQNNYGKKVEIAKKALEFLKDKNTIFLDSSSTVFVFAAEIFKNHFEAKNLITNSPAILVEALKQPHVNLISTGGELRQEFNIFGGNWVNEFLENVNLDCAFLSAAGVSTNLDITTNNKDLAVTLRKVIDKAGEVNLLIDSTKIFKEGMLNIANINEVTRIITDEDIISKIDEKLLKGIDIEIIY